MRNLTKTLAVVSILAPVGAHPLGIGDIKLHSALNQNLNAEIALILSGERPSDIQVNLAPPDKFNEAGVPWSYFLSKIRFQTITRPNGSVVIKLTSNEALKEPFLDLLLEVSWPKGNLFREFTVLVDPPSVYKQATAPVLTTPEQYRQTVEPQIVNQARSSSRKPQRQYTRRGEYGPTRRNDTLWKVAEKVRQDHDVSVEQMMIALYEENPRAFYQENVNALLAGKTLKVPDKEVVVKLSRKEALTEFNRQTKAWSNRLVPNVAESTPVKNEKIDNQLTLDAPAEASVAENAVVTPGKDNESKPGQTNSANAGAIDPNDPVQIKIAALEKQLATMQQIIALKDQQLATLQNQAQAKPTGPDQTVATETVQQAAPLVSPAPEETAVKTEPAATEQAPAVSEPIAQEQAVPPPVKVAEPEPPKPIVQPAPPPVAESSTDLYYPTVGGIGATVLSILGWLWWRKRKIEDETNTESMFSSSGMSKSFGTGGAVTDSMLNTVNTASPESSFLSEFASTDFDSFDIDQGEIDPISEADVYLAYGRYHQAEELIRHALGEYPSRDDCKLKLLEIYQATENKKAFETYAKELVDSGKRDDLQFWAKVTEMGNEVCPDSSLFSSAAANFEMEMQASSTNDSPVSLEKAREIDTNDDEDLEIVSLAPSESSTAAIKDQTDHGTEENELDFDLTSFSVNDDFDISANEQKNNTSIDFDLSALESKDTKPKITEKPAVALDEDRLLDFDFNTEVINDVARDNKKSSEAVSFNLDSYAAAPATKNKLSLSKETSFEDIDFSFDDTFNLSDSDSDEYQLGDYQMDYDESMDDSDFQEKGLGGISDLTDMDECETKLDLARAYIDMGDADAAKGIIKEVVEKGSTEQQKIAQMLMADL